MGEPWMKNETIQLSRKDSLLGYCSLLLTLSLLLAACQPAARITPAPPTPTLVPPALTATAGHGSRPLHGDCHLAPSPTPTPDMNSIPGWLAFIENGRLSIRDLRGAATAEVRGDYRQLWAGRRAGQFSWQSRMTGRAS